LIVNTEILEEAYLVTSELIQLGLLEVVKTLREADDESMNREIDTLLERINDDREDLALLGVREILQVLKNVHVLAHFIAARIRGNFEIKKIFASFISSRQQGFWSRRVDRL
jgi:hypothetical protein